MEAKAHVKVWLSNPDELVELDVDGTFPDGHERQWLSTVVVQVINIGITKWSDDGLSLTVIPGHRIKRIEAVRSALAVANPFEAQQAVRSSTLLAGH